MQPIFAHQGDNLPSIYCQLFDQESGVNNDLSAATTVVTAKFKRKGTTTVLATITCAKVFGGTTGWVRMDWGSTTLDVARGRYEIEVSVSYNGLIETANRYFWDGAELFDAKTLPVKVLTEF
jgi:hypothetical protein